MSRTKMEWNWELIEESPNGHTKTYRAKVFKGWVLWTVVSDGKLKLLNTSQVFIPDTDHQWHIIPPIVPVEKVKPSDFEVKE